MDLESGQRARNPWLWVRLALSLAVTAGVCWWLFSQVGIDAITETLRSALWPWVLGAWLCSVVVTVLKSLRFRALLPTASGGFVRLWGLQSLHTLLNALFPAGVSEFANAYLLRHGYGTPWGEGVVALIVGRVLDVFLFAIVLLVLRISSWPGLVGSPVLNGIGWLSTAGMVVAIVLLGGLIPKRKPLVRWARDALQREGRGHLVSRVCAHGIVAFDQIQSDPYRYARAAVWSIGMWAAMFGVFHMAIRALAPGFRLEHTLFIYLFLWVVSILPIRGVANLGTHEGGWVLGLVALGYAREEAIRLAFGTHAIFFVIAVSLGVFGLALLATTSRVKSRPVSHVARREGQEAKRGTPG